MLAGLDQVADGGAALVDQHMFFVGAMEEDVGHVPHPFAKRISQGKIYLCGIAERIRATPGDSDDLNQTGVMTREGEIDLGFVRTHRALDRARCRQQCFRELHLATRTEPRANR